MYYIQADWEEEFNFSFLSLNASAIQILPELPKQCLPLKSWRHNPQSFLAFKWSSLLGPEQCRSRGYIFCCGSCWSSAEHQMSADGGIAAPVFLIYSSMHVFVCFSKVWGPEQRAFLLPSLTSYQRGWLRTRISSQPQREKDCKIWKYLILKNSASNHDEVIGTRLILPPHLANLAKYAK